MVKGTERRSENSVVPSFVFQVLFSLSANNANANQGRETIMGRKGMVSTRIPHLGSAFLIFPSSTTPSVLFKVAIGSDPPAGPLYKMIPLATSVNTSAEKRAASKDELLRQTSEKIFA